MSASYEDGVYIDDSVLILDEKKPGLPLSVRVFQFLMIAVAGWSAISVWIEALNIPCDPRAVNLAVLVCTGIFYTLCALPSHGLVKLLLGGLFYGLFFYSRVRRLLNAFYILENLAIVRISSYYGTESFRYVADYTAEQADTTLLVIMILIPMVFLLTLAVVRNRLTGLCGLFLFLPVCASFALGLIPSERYLLAYVACTFYLAHSAYHVHYARSPEQKTLLHRVSSRAAIWLSLASVLLFFLMKLFVGREAYDNRTDIKEMKSDIQTAMQSFDLKEFTGKWSEIRLFSRKVSSNGLTGGELSKAGEVRYDNTTHLLLTAPRRAVEEGIYLKGYVGSVYTGSSWTGHSGDALSGYDELMEKLPQELFAPVDQASLFLGHMADGAALAEQESGAESRYDYSFYEGVMKLQYKNANKKYLYTPYFTEYGLLDDIYYDMDLYAVPASRESEYWIPFYYNLDFRGSREDYFSALREKLGDYGDYEKLYRDYVYKVYTQLPEEGLDRLKAMFSPENLELSDSSIAGKIQFIKTYLSQETQYSLSPGALPEGKDFVEYFVFENKAGYCAHYASAAALMLRIMGVPARYAEGYAVRSDSILGESGTQETTRYRNSGAESNTDFQVEVDVKDYNAHAWVEVYFDNYGWVPVEFTPGAAVDYNLTVVQDVDEVSAGIEEDRQKEEQDDDTGEVTPTITPTIAPTAPLVSIAPSLKPAQSGGNSGKSGAARWIPVLLLTVALIVAILGFLGYRIHRRRRAVKSGNPNKKAIFLYGEIEKMLHISGDLPGKKALLEESENYVEEHHPRIGGKELEHLMEIVRRARFGKGWITGTELREVARFHDRLYRDMCGELTWFGRLRLRLRIYQILM